MVDTDKDWIKLHRNLLTNNLWLSESFTRGQAWVDLLLLANHTDGYFINRGIKVDVARGQVGMSELQLSIRWKWSRTKVRSFFMLLESEQQIIQHKNNVNSLITILNYDAYQSQKHQKEQQENTRKTTEEHQKDTNKKVKKEKKEKKENIFIPPTPDEVGEYMIEIGYQGNAQKFHDHYTRNDWRVGKSKTKMKDWKGAVRTWRANGYDRSMKQSTPTVEDRLFDFMAGVKR